MALFSEVIIHDEESTFLVLFIFFHWQSPQLIFLNLIIWVFHLKGLQAFSSCTSDAKTTTKQQQQQQQHTPPPHTTNNNKKQPQQQQQQQQKQQHSHTHIHTHGLGLGLCHNTLTPARTPKRHQYKKESLCAALL